MRAAACRSSCFIDSGDVSAELVLGLRLLFDLLSLEDVQYLSVQFPHYSASELVQLSFFSLSLSATETDTVSPLNSSLPLEVGYHSYRYYHYYRLKCFC